MDTVSMCACVCVFVRVCVGAFQCTWMVCIVCSMERVGSSGEGHGCIQGRWWRWRSRPLYMNVTLKSVDSKVLTARRAVDKSLGLSLPPSLSSPISPSPLSPSPRTIEPNRTNDSSCASKVLELRCESSVQVQLSSEKGTRCNKGLFPPATACPRAALRRWDKPPTARHAEKALDDDSSEDVFPP